MFGGIGLEERVRPSGDGKLESSRFAAASPESRGARPSKLEPAAASGRDALGT